MNVLDRNPQLQAIHLIRLGQCGRNKYTRLIWNIVGVNRYAQLASVELIPIREKTGTHVAKQLQYTIPFSTIEKWVC